MKSKNIIFLDDCTRRAMKRQKKVIILCCVPWTMGIIMWVVCWPNDQTILSLFTNILRSRRKLFVTRVDQYMLTRGILTVWWHFRLTMRNNAEKTSFSCYFWSFVIFHIFPYFSHICQVSTHFFMLPSGIVSTSRVFGVLPFRWQDRTDIIEGNAFTQWKWWKPPTYSIHWSALEK